MAVVAMDCEMVGSGNRSLLARVSIVDWHGSVLLDEYVKPTATVTDYRTSVSGITKKHLEDGKTFYYVQGRVSTLINGKILVGHSLQNDLDVLGLSHPESNRRDLATYRPYMINNQTQSLKVLAKDYLHEDIQQGMHSSVEDAKVAMRLYQRLGNKW